MSEETKLDKIHRIFEIANQKKVDILESAKSLLENKSSHDQEKFNASLEKWIVEYMVENNHDSELYSTIENTTEEKRITLFLTTRIRHYEYLYNTYIKGVLEEYLNIVKNNGPSDITTTFLNDAFKRTGEFKDSGLVIGDACTRYNLHYIKIVHSRICNFYDLMKFCKIPFTTTDVLNTWICFDFSEIDLNPRN